MSKKNMLKKILVLTTLLITSLNCTKSEEEGSEENYEATKAKIVFVKKDNEDCDSADEEYIGVKFQDGEFKKRHRCIFKYQQNKKSNGIKDIKKQLLDRKKNKNFCFLKNTNDKAAIQDVEIDQEKSECFTKFSNPDENFGCNDGYKLVLDIFWQKCIPETQTIDLITELIKKSDCSEKSDQKMEIHEKEEQEFYCVDNKVYLTYNCDDFNLCSEDKNGSCYTIKSENRCFNYKGDSYSKQEVKKGFVIDDNGENKLDFYLSNESLSEKERKIQIWAGYQSSNCEDFEAYDYEGNIFFIDKERYGGDSVIDEMKEYFGEGFVKTTDDIKKELKDLFDNARILV